MRHFLSFIMGAAIVAHIGVAKADTFVWKDAKSGYTASFPDVWRIQTEDAPNNVLRIAGPISEDWATCKIKVDHDGRALIYQKKYVDEAVGIKLNRDFWEEETGQFRDAQIKDFYTPASLGDKGDATAIHVAYKQDNGKRQLIPMYGVMLASLYHDKLYVATCSARHEEYAKYATLFGSLLDSVQLDDRYHPFYTGYYRNFLADPKLVLPRSKPGHPDGTNFVYDYARDFNN